MNREEFFQQFNGMDPNELLRIQWAYDIAKLVHANQKRDTGERYFEHARGVANILVQYGYTDWRDIVLSIMHDSIEDTYIPFSMLEQLFGIDVANDIRAISKIRCTENSLTGRVQLTKKFNLKEYFERIAKYGPRIIRVKGADRIHNLSTVPSPQDISRWTREKRIREVAETRAYVIPLTDIHAPNLSAEISRLCMIVEDGALSMSPSVIPL
jgi:GTP pyrophosphokinase